ncbi:MAG: DsrE family protein [Bacteroidota bacterium]
MKKYATLLFTFLFIFMNAVVRSQEKKAGPVIKEYGKVFKIENTDIQIDTSKTYKAVFDIMQSPESHEKVNPSIETAARFLNMHTQNGVPQNQLKVALVVHNKASKDLMNDEAYRERYSVTNPNTGLIRALIAADVQIVFCGQSSQARGIPKSNLIDGVQLSLSAMTALINLQDENYKLIKF